MNHALEAGQAIHIKGGMTVVIEAGMQLSLKVGGNFIDIISGGRGHPGDHGNDQ